MASEPEHKSALAFSLIIQMGILTLCSFPQIIFVEALSVQQLLGIENRALAKFKFKILASVRARIKNPQSTFHIISDHKKRDTIISTFS